MRKQRVVVSESAKLKIGIWASANKESLAGLTLPDAHGLIKNEFGVEMPESALRTLYGAIGVEPRRRTTQQASEPADVRQLAKIVRNLMRELGIKEIPPQLDKLCGDVVATNGAHQPQFQLLQ